MQWVGTISIYTVMPQYFHSNKRQSILTVLNATVFPQGIAYGRLLQQWWMVLDQYFHRITKIRIGYKIP